MGADGNDARLVSAGRGRTTCATGAIFAASPPRRGYDAEGTVALDGRNVFTSVRDGDLDLYVSDASGGNVKRLTDRPGYDGGPFFSWDGREIVWRGWHPTDPDELADYPARFSARGSSGRPGPSCS